MVHPVNILCITQENSMDVSDISVSDTDEETISPYEAAANRRKQENLQLIKELGIHHLSTQVCKMHVLHYTYIRMYNKNTG